MSEKGEILRVNTTTAIRGGPMGVFMIVVIAYYTIFMVKKVCQLEKTTLRNLCIESTSCGFDCYRVCSLIK